MARSRGRSRGSGLPLGGTLGSLVRTTLAQAGAVKDVLERGAREGKARLDDARRERRREQALARLGEAVLDALRAGDGQELLERADVADALSDVEDLERGAERDRGRDAWVAPPTRERYDRGDDDGTVSSASWRPPAAPASPSARAGRGPARDEREREHVRAPAERHHEADSGDPHERDPHDARAHQHARDALDPRDLPGGTDDDRRPARRAADEPGARFQERRPLDALVPRRAADEPGARFADRRAADEPAPRAPERRRPGGIQFDREGDDDLADYMHPDDLPARPPKGS